MLSVTNPSFLLHFLISIERKRAVAFLEKKAPVIGTVLSVNMSPDTAGFLVTPERIHPERGKKP